MTTLVTADEVPALMDLAGQLGLSITVQAAPGTVLTQADDSNIESLRKGLEDLYNLL